MCGRFIQRQGAQVYAAAFGVDAADRGFPNTPPRYNGAPGQDFLVIRHNPETGARTLDVLRWGLVPVWAKDPKTGYKMINARAETADRLPAYRAAFARRRCLVPADGFYEWKAGTTPRQPYAITLASGEPFVLAGLWEGWQDKASGEWLRTFTLITCEPNSLVGELHNRMPAIVAPEHHGRWLEEGGKDLLRPYPAEAMTMRPVSIRVNSPGNNDPSILD